MIRINDRWMFLGSCVVIMNRVHFLRNTRSMNFGQTKKAVSTGRVKSPG